MRQKSDKKKLLEGRCLGSGSDYVGFIKANEFKNRSSASQLYDPIADRTVDVLSAGERIFFWIKRYDETTKGIYEQYALNKESINEICDDFGFRRPIHILTTDFLIEKTDGSMEAFSIKENRAVFDPETTLNQANRTKYEKLIVRQRIEKEYWDRMGVPFHIVFREELDSAYAKNIETCMAFYRGEYVTDAVSKLKFLIAHHLIDVVLEKAFVNFSKLAEKKSDEIEAKLSELREEAL